MTVQQHPFTHPLLTSADGEGPAHLPTVYEFLKAGAEKWPDSIWCRTPEDECTRSQALDAGRRIAAGLAARGVSAADRILVVLPNGMDFVYTWIGLIFSRAVLIAVNPHAAATELSAVVEELDARLVIAADTSLTCSVDIVTVEELLGHEPLDRLPAEDATEEEPVSFIQSSGSTGRPKFVIETNRLYTMGAEGFPYWLTAGEKDVMMTTLPLTHLNAQVYSLQGSYGVGAELVLLPRFSASTFWKDAVRFGVTQFNAIGAMVEALMNQPVTEEELNNSVRLCYSAPTPSLERHQEIEQRFGLRLVMGYALSESPYGLIVPTDRPNVYDTMGTPRQHPVLGTINEARIADEAGNDLPDGVLGEFELRSQVISPGYFGNPEETAAMRRPDGWLRTGDLAIRRSDGYFIFGGRKKEVIRYRGENVSPVEVENVIDAHPTVVSSAVIGVPSPMTEEDIKAFVLLKPGESISGEELGRWCEERLVRYKRPRYIEFVDQWPLTETQKIAKKQLSRERSEKEVDVVKR